MTGPHFVGAVVAAQVLAQIGAFILPALLPGFIDRWDLSGTQAGWLVGVFFAAYVAAVPMLVALTDRLPARRIYMIGAGCTALSHLGFALVADGFWAGLGLRALAGIGWAGCYMPGLKLLADRLEGAGQARAVGWHAAGVGVAGAASFLVAGALDGLGGPQAAFLFGAIAGFGALAIAVLAMPDAAPVRGVGRLLDLRPVLANRAAMAWIAGYAVHTWELAVLRAWGVTFLATAIARHGAPGWLPGASVLFALAGLLGIAVSLAGNEMAVRLGPGRVGRGRVVAVAMGGGALMSVLAGASLFVSAPLAALAVLAWNAAIYLDSSALTAGTVQAAEPARRGATMGLHSMCGYAGGFVGPLAVGVILDLAGGATAWGWVLAFGHVAPVTLLGWWVVSRLSQN